MPVWTAVAMRLSGAHRASRFLMEASRILKGESKYVLKCATLDIDKYTGVYDAADRPSGHSSGGYHEKLQIYPEVNRLCINHNQHIGGIGSDS